MCRITEVSHDRLDLLERAYHAVYVNAFPLADERESLANMIEYLRLKKAGRWGDGAYHIGITVIDGAPVAMSVSDYFSRTRTGVIEFILVDPAFRGRGMGTRLLAWTEGRMLRDAARLSGARLRAVLGEMDDPFSRRPERGELDPFERSRMWQRWGYSVLDFAYVQPALSRGQQPVRHLALIAKPLAPRHALPADLVRDTLAEYLRLAMRIPDPENHREFRDMCTSLLRAAKRNASVRLIPMGEYLGRILPNGAPLHILEVRPVEETLDEVLSLYESVFADAATRAPRSDFMRFLNAASAQDSERSRMGRQPWFRYHLWAVRRGSSSRLCGFTSFFAFCDAGFGGYLALAGRKTSRRGMLRALVARIEEQLLRDSPEAEGWFIEVEPNRATLIRHFQAHGFFRVGIRFLQPSFACGARKRAAEKPLALLYKPIGRVYSSPQLRSAMLLRWHSHLLQVVYGFSTRSSAYRRLQQALCDQLEGKTVAPLHGRQA